MAISIQDHEAEALLGEIRDATGKELSQIVLDLARGEAQRLRRLHDIEARRKLIDDISRRAAAKLPADLPTPDEIIGYDEHGLPR